MKDCNLTLNYAHELRRMCAAHHACRGCPMQHTNSCLTATRIDLNHIETVQKWSNANPDPLNKRKLIDDFKEYWGADVAEEDFELYLNLLDWLENEVEKI